MKCHCHEIELRRDERAWLKEDGTVLCDDGHWDDCRDDPFDRFDHGTPYTASTLADAGFEAVRARITTPNHKETSR